MSKRVLIVDDEKLARDRITRLISELGYDFDISEADSGLAALEKMPSIQPEILFLDIQMPGLTGLEVLQQVEHRPFKIIFQTAYDEYAIQAFDESACDYLLKPYTKDRLKLALERALTSLDQVQRIGELEREFQKRDGYLRRISVRQGDKIRLIEVDEIHCLVSRDHYTFIHTGESEFISDLSLTHLAERLDPEKFLRCHRNNIICLERVDRLAIGANMTVHLLCGLELPVSRSNRQLLQEKIRS
ncbi:MAG: LytR/AlgR family response regulator transcription factor [Bdellovibrionales bacterium]